MQKDPFILGKTCLSQARRHPLQRRIEQRLGPSNVCTNETPTMALVNSTRKKRVNAMGRPNRWPNYLAVAMNRVVLFLDLYLLVPFLSTYIFHILKRTNPSNET